MLSWVPFELIAAVTIIKATAPSSATRWFCGHFLISAWRGELTFFLYFLCWSVINKSMNGNITLCKLFFLTFILYKRRPWRSKVNADTTIFLWYSTASQGFLCVSFFVIALLSHLFLAFRQFSGGCSAGDPSAMLPTDLRRFKPYATGHYVSPSKTKWQLCSVHVRVARFLE